MGNSASKKAKQEQLAVAEQKYAAAAATIASRDEELARKDKQLDLTKADGFAATNEASTLRKKVEELDALCTALEEERQKHVAKLQSDLKRRDDDMAAARRVAESRTQERDDARRLVSEAEQKAKDVEDSSRISREQYEQQMKDLQEAKKTHEQELRVSTTGLSQLREKVAALEQSNQKLTDELSKAESAAAEELAASNAVAAQELSAVQASFNEASRSREESEKTLASTRQALTISESKRDALQKTHNESVSRRAASHEAFTATKQELVEAQQKYHELYEENEKRGRDLDENLSAAKKDLAEAREKHEGLQLEFDKLVALRKITDDELMQVKQDLDRERETQSSLKAGHERELKQRQDELAVLQKKLVDAERRKSRPEVQVEEVQIGNDSDFS